MDNPEQKIKDLEAKVDKLNKVIIGLEGTSKMLVRRDLDLQKAYISLKSLDKEKSEFVAIAAHQLRTPLTTTIWAHRMIMEDETENLTEKQVKLLERSTTSVEHIQELVEELIQVDKLEYGNNDLELQSGNIEKVLESLINSHQPKIEERGLIIEKQYHYSEAVSFDSHQLSEALGNLIDNAIKYTPDKGKITVSVKKDDNFVCIEVIDTGIGVPPGKEGSLFKKFSRISNAESVDASGSGLGLYIARKIVEKHKGMIAYSPSNEGGSVFSVKIPC